jgi:hypothetical protein
VRKIIITGLFAAVLAACAATAAPALAHEFVASQTKGVIQDKSTSKQVFEINLTTFECAAETSKGFVQAKQATAIKDAVEYTGCTFLGATAEVSQAKYEFKAEGTMALENEVKVKIPSLECEIKIPSAGNQELSSVSYTNNQQHGTIELKATVAGITATLGGTGSFCPKGETKTAKYKGSSQVFDLACLPTVGGAFKDPLCRQKGPPGLYDLYAGFPIRWL